MKNTNKSKPYVHIINLMALRRSIIIMHAQNIDELRKAIYKNKSTLTRNSKSGIKDICNSIIDVVKKEIGESRGFTFRGDGDVYIFLSENRSDVLVHEAVHAAGLILDMIGSTCDELRAYIVEHIFFELCWGTNDKNEKAKVR